MTAHMKHAVLTLLLWLIPALAVQANDFNYKLTPQMIAGDVYVLIGTTEDFSFGNGGNIVNSGFIVGTTGVIVIDTGSSRRYGEQLLAAIAAITDKPIALTINTHHHPDHFLGNQAFPANTLAATPETIQGIRTEGEGFSANLYRMSGDWMLGTEVVVPTQTLAAGRRNVGGRDLEFLPLAGHTASDLVVIDHDSGTVFAADLIFNRRTPTTPHADITRWLASLDALEALPAQRWVPGHGAVSDDTTPIRDTRAYLSWLAETIKHGAESGLDMTEMLATPIPDAFKTMALATREFERSVTHLYPAAERAALER